MEKVWWYKWPEAKTKSSMQSMECVRCLMTWVSCHGGPEILNCHRFMSAWGNSTANPATDSNNKHYFHLRLNPLCVDMKNYCPFISSLYSPVQQWGCWEIKHWDGTTHCFYFLKLPTVQLYVLEIKIMLEVACFFAASTSSFNYF